MCLMRFVKFTEDGDGSTLANTDIKNAVIFSAQVLKEHKKLLAQYMDCPRRSSSSTWSSTSPPAPLRPFLPAMLRQFHHRPHDCASVRRAFFTDEKENLWTIKALLTAAYDQPEGADAVETFLNNLKETGFLFSETRISK
jgi:hypothetical protein